MNHAFRIASELVYATIAYNEAKLADDLDSNDHTYQVRRDAYDYMVRVQNELHAQCLMLAKEPV